MLVVGSSRPADQYRMGFPCCAKPIPNPKPHACAPRHVLTELEVAYFHMIPLRHGGVKWNCRAHPRIGLRTIPSDSIGWFRLPSPAPKPIRFGDHKKRPRPVGSELGGPASTWNLRLWVRMRRSAAYWVAGDMSPPSTGTQGNWMARIVAARFWISSTWWHI